MNTLQLGVLRVMISLTTEENACYPSEAFLSSTKHSCTLMYNNGFTSLSFFHLILLNAHTYL